MRREIDIQVGARVARELPSATPKKDIAVLAGMTPGDFARALNGDRAFTAIELDAIEGALYCLDGDVEFLMAGTSSPGHNTARARWYAHRQVPDDTDEWPIVDTA